MGEGQQGWDATRKYVKYFNAHDLDNILDLLDDAVISSRQSVPGVSVGPRAIRSRLKKLWSGSSQKKKKPRSITALCALVDINQDGFVPCVALLNHQKVAAFILLEVNVRGQIYLHTEITRKSAFARLKFCCPHQKFPTPDTRTCPNLCQFDNTSTGAAHVPITDLNANSMGRS